MICSAGRIVSAVVCTAPATSPSTSSRAQHHRADGDRVARAARARSSSVQPLCSRSAPAARRSARPRATGSRISTRRGITRPWRARDLLDCAPAHRAAPAARCRARRTRWRRAPCAARSPRAARSARWPRAPARSGGSGKPPGSAAAPRAAASTVAEHVGVDRRGPVRHHRLGPLEVVRRQSTSISAHRAAGVVASARR